jgi:hypothetical protein
MSKSIKNASPTEILETPIAPPAVEEDNFLAAETGQDFGDVEVGGKKWRTLQVFHEDHKTRRRTPLEMGGFGIRTADEPVPGMGEKWDVPYASGEKEEMLTFNSFTGALIGWTEKYTAMKGTAHDAEGKEKAYFQPVPVFVNDDEIASAKASGALPQSAKLRSTSCIDLFFVLKGDPNRNVFRLRIKNYDLLVKFAATLNAARALAQKANAPLCAIWLEWKLADAIEVGKGVEKAIVNGIELASTTVENSMKASRTEYFGQVDEHGGEIPGLKARSEEVKAFLDDPADPYFIKAAKQLKGNNLARLPAMPSFARLLPPSPTHVTNNVIEAETVTL